MSNTIGIDFLGHFNFIIATFLMMTGLFIVISSGNLVKKLLGLGIFQTAVLLFYVSLGWIKDSSAPILREGITVYANPVPQVLMLTAIVVGVATMAVGLAIAIRIKHAYGTIDESEIRHEDRQLATRRHIPGFKSGQIEYAEDQTRL